MSSSEMFDPIPARDLSPVGSEKIYGDVNRKPVENPKWSQSETRLVSNHDDIQSSWEASTWFWLVIIPIVVFILLIVLTPTFIEISKTTENPERLNPTSLLLWTLIITLLIWILFWGFSKCKTC